MTLAIETQKLGKNFGRVKAVQDLTLQVAEGEIYAFLGLNGAGKTTTIRLLLGMIRPSSGYAQVLQTRVGLGQREPWAKVGYLVETPHCYPELTVRENLEVARRWHPGTPLNAVSQTINKLGLSPYAERKAGTLSLGNHQRLGLAKALIHNPRLLFLDEPANGLDPAGIVEIRELLLTLTRQEGVTVFMSSHILAEVSRLADRVGIIHQGRLLQELDIEQLERNRIRRLWIECPDPKAAQALLQQDGVTVSLLEDGRLALSSPEALAHPEQLNRRLVEGGIFPRQVVIEEEDLEAYFLRLVGNNGGKHE
jgi:ABC-2 type transport system ATP-binding protein